MSTRGVHQEISLCFLQKREVADCIFVRNSKSWKTHNFPNYRQELYVIIQAAGHHEGICIFQIDWPSRIESGSVNRILFVVQMDESTVANHPTLWIEVWWLFVLV